MESLRLESGSDYIDKKDMSQERRVFRRVYFERRVFRRVYFKRHVFRRVYFETHVFSKYIPFY